MRRYERASTLVTSNRPGGRLGRLLGDAAAVGVGTSAGVRGEGGGQACRWPSGSPVPSLPQARLRPPWPTASSATARISTRKRPPNWRYLLSRQQRHSEPVDL